MLAPLTALKMSWHEADDRHDELVVSMAVLDEVCNDRAAFPHITEEQLADAAEFGAGILGRIATPAFAEVILEAREHGCRRRGSVARTDHGRVLVDGCSISGPASLLMPRTAYSDDAPALWIVVPHGHVTAWRERINAWLQQITDDRPAAVSTARQNRNTA